MDFAELFRDATASDIALFAFMAFGIPFCFMAVLSAALSKFVGLKAEPDRRALLTVLPAYVIVTLLCVFGFGSIGMFQIAMPVAGALMALLIYWYWRKEFRAAWVENDAGLPEGINLANDDWRVGLAALVALIVAAAIKVLFIRGAG